MTYPPEQIAFFAEQQKCSVERFKERWIIVSNGACFIHGVNGYRPPVKHSLDLAISLRKHLAPVPSSKVSPAGIDWEVPLGSGTKEKTVEKIITEYGSVAARHILCTDIEYSFYDASTETFYERVCRLRPLEPTFDEQVDTWLRYLGGDNPETLLDWVATCPDLSRPTAAVYLHAGKDAGKTMFANGIARLWGESATPLASAVSSFNSAVVDCPLIFADEEIPRGVSSGFIRDFVSARARQIRRKNMTETTQKGTIRLVIAANGPDILKFDREDLNVDDIEAVAARILYFKCSPEAAKYLKKLGGNEGTADWVDGDRIAKHALWLRQNREAKRGTRFLVEGGVDVTHRNSIATSGGQTRSRAVEWICRAMLEDWMEPNPGIRFGGGELYINASFVQQNWEKLLGDNRPPSLQQISKAFKPLTVKDQQEKRFDIGLKRPDGKCRRADFYRIDPQYVYDNASTLQIGTEETFRGLINRPAALDGGDGGGSPSNGNGAAPQPAATVLPLSNPYFNPPASGTSLFDLLK